MAYIERACQGHNFDMYTWTCMNCGLPYYEFQNQPVPCERHDLAEAEVSAVNDKIWNAIRKASNS